jgi:hypothetical protein
MAAAVRTATISGEGVFSVRIVAGVADVASAITGLVSLEVVEALRPALRQRSNVTVVRIKAIVDVAPEAVRSVKPGAGSDKHAANKPIRPVITVRSAVIRGIVEVPVRADGSRSDVYADRNLGSRHRRTAEKASNENCESKHTDFEHDSSLISFGVSVWTTEAQHNTGDR